MKNGSVLFTALLGIMIAGHAFAADSQEERVDPNKKLKDTYLKCDKATHDGEMDMETAVACNRFYEALMTAEFHGDFVKFLEWWSKNKLY